MNSSMLKIFPAERLALQNHGNESKHSFISPHELHVFTQRQKSLDWVMQLSRDYDVLFLSVGHLQSFSSRMSIVELEQFILSMRDSVRSHLQAVDPENVAFIAHLLTQELYNVRFSVRSLILSSPSLLRTIFSFFTLTTHSLDSFSASPNKTETDLPR